MAKGPSPQPWQVEQSKTLPPGSKATPPRPVVGDDMTVMKRTSAANPSPAAPSSSIPTDPKGFQQYLKDHGANLGKTGPKKDGVDGVIGPKTLAEAARLGVPVPASLAPVAPQQPAPAPQNQPAPQTAPQQVQTAQATTDVVPRATVDEIRARYGYLGALLDYPDVAEVIAGYDSTRDSDAQFLARLKATPTFQTHSQNELNWTALKPADQQTRIDAQKAAITNEAQTLGVTLDPGRLTQIATDALRFGWTPQQVSNALGGEFQYKAGGQQGKIGVGEATIRKMAASYLMPLSDDTLAAWDKQLAEGADPEMFRQTMVNIAKGRFPTIADLLDKGVTVAAIAEPYKQTAAKELGRDPNSIDFNDPMWSRALTFTDQKGNRRLMDDYEWQKTLRTDEQYGWDKTQNGIAAGYRVGNALSSALGLRA